MDVEFGKRGIGRNRIDGRGDGIGRPSSAQPWAPDWNLQDWLRMGAQIAAAALIGFGVMLWVAAHWGDISRFGRFGIVGSVLAASVLISLINAARVPGLIVAFLATGGLFALIGQTYQTGADPWQLFAIWAAVGLPWVLAARSDALWLVWSVVAMLGITLWLTTVVGFGGWSTQRGAVLAAWLMAIAITVLLSPHVGLANWLGETRWAFRLMMVLTIALVTHSAIADLFSTKGMPALYWLALAALGGAAVAMSSAAALDIVLVSVLGLSLDTLLITGFGKLVLQAGSADFAGFLLIGFAGAALVAGTGAFILKLMREHAGGGLDLDVLKRREWPVILMTGIGALLTALPLGVGLGLLFGVFLTTGIGPYLIGAGILVGSVTMIRSHAQTSFLHQLAAIGLTLGYALVAFGLFRDSSGAIALPSAALMLLAIGLAVAVGRSWTAALLGAAAGIFAATFLNQLLALDLLGKNLERIAGTVGWALVLAVGSVWLVWRAGPVIRPGRPVASGATAALFDGQSRAVGGAMAAALLGAMATAGPTFLLSGAIGIDGFGAHRHLTKAIELSWFALSPLSAVLALAGCALLLAPRPQYQTALGFGAAIVVVVLSAVMPSLGGPVLLLCAASATGNRTLSIGALIAALWIVGSFYYWLGWPLSAKAVLMLVAGLVLAGLCVATGLRRPTFGLAKGVAAPPLVARALAVAGAVATGGLAAQSITANEAIISSGRQIFLSLAPVDPRSLMQGDYMRLNFAVPAEVRRSAAARDASGRRWAVARLDDRHIATVEQMTEAAPDSVGTDQVVLPMRLSHGRWIVGTDAWFFEEGTAAKWQQARFGIFRVGTNGTALLVGMADKDLAEIK